MEVEALELLLGMVELVVWPLVVDCPRDWSQLVEPLVLPLVAAVPLVVVVEEV